MLLATLFTGLVFLVSTSECRPWETLQGVTMNGAYGRKVGTSLSDPKWSTLIWRVNLPRPDRNPLQHIEDILCNNMTYPFIFDIDRSDSSIITAFAEICNKLGLGLTKRRRKREAEEPRPLSRKKRFFLGTAAMALAGWNKYEIEQNRQRINQLAEGVSVLANQQIMLAKSQVEIRSDMVRGFEEVDAQMAQMMTTLTGAIEANLKLIVTGFSKFQLLQAARDYQQYRLLYKMASNLHLETWNSFLDGIVPTSLCTEGGVIPDLVRILMNVDDSALPVRELAHKVCQSHWTLGYTEGDTVVLVMLMPVSGTLSNIIQIDPLPIIQGGYEVLCPPHTMYVTKDVRTGEYASLEPKYSGLEMDLSWLPLTSMVNLETSQRDCWTNVMKNGNFRGCQSQITPTREKYALANIPDGLWISGTVEIEKKCGNESKKTMLQGHIILKGSVDCEISVDKRVVLGKTLETSSTVAYVFDDVITNTDPPIALTELPAYVRSANFTRYIDHLKAELEALSNDTTQIIKNNKKMKWKPLTEMSLDDIFEKLGFTWTLAVAITALVIAVTNSAISIVLIVMVCSQRKPQGGGAQAYSYRPLPVE